MLRTQAEEGDALQSFAHSARLLAGQLDASDTDLRRLITTAPVAATQVSGLLRDLDPQPQRAAGEPDHHLRHRASPGSTAWRSCWCGCPQVVAAGATAIDSKGVNFGMAVTFFSPLPCTTGYGGTTYRNGLDTARRAAAQHRGALHGCPPSSGSTCAARPTRRTAAGCRCPRGRARSVPPPGRCPGHSGCPRCRPVQGSLSDLLGLER